jgi:uncharacterized damage-inducible protein DinB
MARPGDTSHPSEDGPAFGRPPGVRTASGTVPGHTHRYTVAVTDTRTDPPLQGSERELLVTFLDWHRATLAVKCDGLTDTQLRERAVPPSSLSLLGLVRHMTEVERAWFQRRLGGLETPPMYWSDDDPDGDFDNVEAADVADAFERWRAACDAARRIVEATDSLDAIAKAPTRDGSYVSLRWILIHMIEEYARHNGHADFLRERIDGTVGE